MTFCEVIVNFDYSNFDAVRKILDAKDVVFFVDNLMTCYKIRDMGLKAEHVRYHFGYVNPSLYAMYDRAIEEARRAVREVADIKYCGISIIDGLHSYIMDRLTYVEKIRHILDQKIDVVFLFSRLEYIHYPIISLAQELGYQTRYGISSFTDGKLVSIGFEDAYRINYKFLYDEKNAKEFDPGTDIFIPSFSIDAGVNNPQCGFFLVNNEEDFYLKPVYPIMSKFEEKNIEKVNFSFSSRTTRLLKRNSKSAYDLFVQMDAVESEMLQKNQKLIAYFFYRLANIKDSSATSREYFKHFGNDRIGRDMARLLSIIAIEDAVFSRYKFKSVFVGLDGVSETEYACSLARKYGIPSFSIPPAMTESAPIYGYLYTADKLLLSGPRLKRELVNLGVAEDRLIVTGNPRFDYIKNGGTHAPNDQNKLVLLAMSRMHERDEEWMIDLIQYCSQKGLDVFMKLHPLYEFTPDLKEICEEKIKIINENCQGMKYQISYNADTTSLLPSARLLITEYSLLGVEAAVHEKPLIVANMANEIFYDYSFQFHKEGIALYSTNSQELIDCIEKILGDSATDERLEQGRKKFISEFNYLNDGKAADRVFDILIKGDG